MQSIPIWSNNVDEFKPLIESKFRVNKLDLIYISLFLDKSILFIEVNIFDELAYEVLE